MFRQDGDDNPSLDMPELGEAEYLAGWFLECGPSMSGDPLTYQEIAAWAGLTGIEPAPWEAAALRRMSRMYVHHARMGENANAASPWDSDRLKETAAQRQAEKFKAFARAHNMGAKKRRR